MNKKIPKALLVERRKKVWELRTLNYSYEDIAKELAISTRTVAKILNKITKKYLDDHFQDVERIKAEQISQHENAAKEAYQAWERSKHLKTDQDGDPRYLSEFMKAKEHIRKIVGANAPIKVTYKNQDYEQSSDLELIQHAKEIFNFAATAIINSDNPGIQEEIDTLEAATRPPESRL